MNKKIALCLSVLLIWSSVAVAELDVSETAKTLTQYMYMKNLDKPKEERVKTLDGIKEEIATELKSKPNDPVLWWLDGLADLSYVYAWNLSWKDDPKNIDIIQDQKMVAVEKFRKALELDNPDDPRLSLGMLYSLKNFGSSDVHVQAAQRILDEGPKLEQREEIELRGGMITHFMKLERYDDVMEQVEIIEKKYPNSEYGRGARDYYIKAIAEAKQEKEQSKEKESEPAQPEPAEPSEPKTQPVPPTDQSEASPDQTKEPTSSIESELTRQVLIIAFVLIGLAVILYIIFRPRKK